MKLGANFLPEDFPVYLESLQAAEEAGYARAWLVDSQMLWEDVCERDHLTPTDTHHLERRPVEVRQRRAGALLDDDGEEVAEARVLRRRRDALVRQDSGEDDGERVEAPQDELEVRVVEGREPVLLDEPVAVPGLELGEDLVAPGADAKAAVSQERPELEQRAGIARVAEAVARPNDRNPARPRLAEKHGRRLG